MYKKEENIGKFFCTVCLSLDSDLIQVLYQMCRRTNLPQAGHTSLRLVFSIL